ncbi:MAG: MBL fold metallo-hydrolase [Acidobacteriota bacterium]
MSDSSSARRPQLTRRQMLAAGGAVGLQAWLGGLAPRRAHASTDASGTVAKEAWARIDRLGDNLWSVISDPLSGNYLTVSNGGIIAGSERVLLFDAFMSPDGAKWVAEQAKALTGRWPTDVVISHYHGDHVNGLAGLHRDGESPRVWVTEHTRTRTLETDAASERADERRKSMLEAVDPISTDGPTRIDLGGRSVSLHTRSGHTGSDVTLEFEDPGTIFWGDLLWIGMFPNYRDATPSQIAATVRELAARKVEHHVSGHGPVATKESIAAYLDMLDHVEAAARTAHEKGQSAEEAAKAFKLPKATADWHLFQPTYFQTAIAAWHRELGG